MASKIFVMETRENGTGRLSLSFRGERGSGISRIACDLTQDGLLQLVLFAEANGLRDTLGDTGRSELLLNGLVLDDDPTRGEITVLRKTGFSEQTARVGRDVFQAEMAGVVDICLARAEESKHGERLKELIAACPLPEQLQDRLAPDEADAVRHRLHEIALLLLAANTMERGSPLARLLRRKKDQTEAEREVAGFVRSLALGLLPRTESAQA